MLRTRKSRSHSRSHSHSHLPPRTHVLMSDGKHTINYIVIEVLVITRHPNARRETASVESNAK